MQYIYGEINNCYSTGNVDCDGAEVGGLVGNNMGYVNNSFWDTETSGRTWSDGGTGKTTARMKVMATFTDTDSAGLSSAWDFEINPYDDNGNNNYWDLDNENGIINDGYPFLSWQNGDSVAIADLTGPISADITMTIDEDETYTFSTADFSYADNITSSLQDLKITALESAGSLQNGGVDVALNEVVSDVTQLTFTPGTDENGFPYATFQFQVNDAVGNWSADYTVTFNVRSVNDSPVVADTIPDQIAYEDAAFTFTFGDTVFNDGDTSDSLRYTATLSDASALPNWLSFEGANPRTFSGTPGNDDIDTLTVKVTATDDSAASAFTAFELAVINTNDPPILTAIPDTMCNEDSRLTISVTASDVDAMNNLLLSVSADTSAVTAEFSAKGSELTQELLITPQSNWNGTATITIVVNDQESKATDTTGFTITILARNDAPVITTTELTAAMEDQTYHFSFTATDPDLIYGDTLTYALSVSPQGMTIDTNTGEITWLPDNGDVGDTSLTVTVSDDSSATDEESFTLTVHNTNDPPLVANTIPNQIATEDSLFSFTFGDTVFTDIDADDSLRFTANLSDGSALPDWLGFEESTPRTFSGTPTNEDIDTISVQVTAIDDSAANTATEFEITVININDPPVITNLPDTAFAEDKQLSLGLNYFASFVEDPDTPDSLLSFAISEANLVHFSLEEDSLFLYAAPNIFGVDTLIVAVNDGEYQDSTPMIVNILPVNDAPIFTEIMPDTIRFDSNQADTLELTGLFTDIDTPDSLLVLSYVYSRFVNYERIDSLNIIKLSTENNQAGTDTLILSVSDGELETIDSVLIQVKKITGIDYVMGQTPKEFKLYQNYPNPFNPTTHIIYSIPQDCEVELRIYDIRGREIALLVKEKQGPKNYRVIWDGCNQSGRQVASGIYFYQIIAKSKNKTFIKTKKMMFLE